MADVSITQKITATLNNIAHVMGSTTAETFALTNNLVFYRYYTVAANGGDPTTGDSSGADNATQVFNAGSAATDDFGSGWQFLAIESTQDILIGIFDSAGAFIVHYVHAGIPFILHSDVSLTGGATSTWPNTTSAAGTIDSIEVANVSQTDAATVQVLAFS